MLKTIFSNESFLIESIKALSNNNEINLGYIITPKLLNVPVPSFKYLKKIENIMQHIGAAQIKENKTFQYFLTPLQWGKITTIVKENAFYADKDVEFELDRQESHDQQRLFNLLNDLNNDIDYGEYAES